MHVLTISISCRHPISVLSIVVILVSSLFCCSIVQSTALFCCVVYFFAVYRIVLSFSYCPVYCVILVSSLLCHVIFQSIRVYHCPFYCMIMLLSSPRCCSFVWFIGLCYWAVSCVVQFILPCIVQFILHCLLLGL